MCVPVCACLLSGPFSWLRITVFVQPCGSKRCVFLNQHTRFVTDLCCTWLAISFPISLRDTGMLRLPSFTKCLLFFHWGSFLSASARQGKCIYTAPFIHQGSSKYDANKYHQSATMHFKSKLKLDPDEKWV